MYTGKLFTRCAVMLLIASAGSVMAVDHQVIPHHLPDAAVNAQATGRLPADQRLTFSMSLPLRNQDALTNLLAEIYNPASPKFHHFLNSAQFTLQFGPKLQDYQDLIAFAQANGFTIQHTHPGQTLLLVNAAVADVERAFGVTMRTYKHPTENREFHAPDGNLTVNLATTLLDIRGLSDFEKPHRISSNLRPVTRSKSAATPNVQATGQATPQAETGTGPSGLYMGSDFRNAYVPNCTLDGTGQTVGLFELDGYYASDIVNYENQAGLPHVSLINEIFGTATGQPSANADAVCEVSLDIEMAIAMAPGLTSVRVYEASTNDSIAIFEDMIAQMADDGAGQISSSWTLGTTPDPTMDNHFIAMATQGQSLFQASGDTDAYNNNNQVQWPADDPNLTSVGGTMLNTSSAGGPWASETVWNIGRVGSSGGVSPNYSIPSWQQYNGVTNNHNGASSTMRNLPDVALTATNVFIVANNGNEYQESGTSCAAPLWAGFIALVNQQAAANGLPPVGFLNPALYAIGTNNSLYTLAFHDIRSGNNTNSTSPTQYYAVSGYDLCTGWGTPNGTNLINALSPSHALRILPFTPNYSFTYQPSTGVIPATQTFTLINTTANAFNWRVFVASTNNWLVGAPSGLQPLPAGASTNLNVYVDPSAITNLASGVYNATLTFQTSGQPLFDPQIRIVTLNMEMPTVVDGGFETATRTNIWPWQVSSSNTYFMITNTVAVTNGSTGHVITNSTGTNLTLFLLANNNGAKLYPGLSDVCGSQFVHFGGFGGSNGFAMGGVARSKGYLYQQMEVATNMYYLLSFWMNNPVDCGNTPAQNGHYTNMFEVLWNSNVVYVVSNMLVNPAWKNHQFILKPPHPQLSSLQFVGFNGLPPYYNNGVLPRIGAFGLDDVSLTPFPGGDASQGSASGQIKLSWPVYATSVTYQLQHTTNLAQSAWTNVGPAISGVTGTVNTNLIGSGDKNSFYRMLMSAPQSN